jgi:hypothetical protein
VEIDLLLGNNVDVPRKTRKTMLLPNLALWDQGAPPAAARSARHPDNVGRIHRGTAGSRSAHADRPARRNPRAGDGSATTDGEMTHRAAPSASIV